MKFAGEASIREAKLELHNAFCDVVELSTIHSCIFRALLIERVECAHDQTLLPKHIGIMNLMADP